MPKKITKKVVKKIAKKSAKKVVSKSKLKSKVDVRVSATKEGKPIGIISHYFAHIGVCVVKLNGTLKEGEMIRIVGGEETDFMQPVNSMQIDHEKVMVAKKGDSIGLKIKEKAREGYRVFKI